MDHRVSLADATDAVDQEPLLTEATRGDGGTQGLRWHDEALRADSDGDRAHAFLVLRPLRERGAPAVQVRSRL